MKTKKLPNLKICILSDYSNKYTGKYVTDEGIRKTAHSIWQELSNQNTLVQIHISDSKLKFLNNLFKIYNQIRIFKPEIIHIIPGPTLSLFFLNKILKILNPKAKMVMSAPRPQTFSKLFKFLIPILKPDMILTQSSNATKTFQNLGCNVEFLPSGVNLNRFVPTNEINKKKLKKKFNFDEKKPLLLHVGSIRKIRNLESLIEIKKHIDIEILIVGSTSLPIEKNLLDSLIENNLRIMTNYVESIEEIYSMADCYIFPVTINHGAIEIPLSIIEAMSCNLPILTTRFGGVPDIFNEKDGLFYIESNEEMVKCLKNVLKPNFQVNTRKHVLQYSWENIGFKLNHIYNELIKNK